jgi:hypothetical protein
MDTYVRPLLQELTKRREKHERQLEAKDSLLRQQDQLIAQLQGACQRAEGNMSLDIPGICKGPSWRAQATSDTDRWRRTILPPHAEVLEEKLRPGEDDQAHSPAEKEQIDAAYREDAGLPVVQQTATTALR